MTEENTKGCGGGSISPATTSRVNVTRAEVARLRLGRHERRILLLAAPIESEDGARIEPPGPGRAADEAHRRAIRRLYRAGLVHIAITYAQVPVVRHERAVYGVPGDAMPLVAVERNWTYRKRVVWLSPLGSAIVQCLRPQLESGHPIRWDRALPVIVAAEDTYQLQLDAVNRKEAENREKFRARMAAMMAAFSK